MNLLQQPSILLFLFILGIIAQYFSFLPKDGYRSINKFILYVPLPAIVLTKIPFLEITHEVIFPIASAWIIFFASAVFAYIFCRIMKYDKKTMACLILCCGLGNTSFVGYPILKYFYGEQSLQYAIFVDQPGSFLILSTFGILVATYFSASSLDTKQMGLRLIKFPPFLIFILALFLQKELITGNTFYILDLLGKFMVPLAILSLGLQFKLSLKEIEWKKLSAGLFYKLLLAPFIVFVLFYFILNKQGELYTVSVLECAMPPMITSSILAIEYNLDEKLANALPTLGILFSVPTLLFWKWLLTFY
jgi:predicted permease